MSINAWGSDKPAEVTFGGTGNATLTDGGILLGSGTSPVTVTAQPTNGQVLIGSTGSDPVLAVPTGDTNEIAIGTGAGTLSIGIADNPVLPGNASVTIPVGTSAQEPAVGDGKMRYDSDTDKLRASVNGVWVDVATGGAGALTYITTVSPSAVSEQVLDNTVINTYQHFLLVYDLLPVTDDVNLYFEISNDNGSTWHTSNYYSLGFVTGGTLVVVASTTQFVGTGGTGSAAIGNVADEGAWGNAYFYNMLDASQRTTMNAVGSEVYPFPSGAITQGGGRYRTAEANNAIRIYFSSGNIASGRIDVYGIKASV